ncbi:hypothetical protein [Bacillus sp. FJAT-50079]|uniref:hypothetical protein n=1 Tax=Bacillus sp. FJAT-50079 TaxID=2833577 RepID=UPI001BC9FAFD|nr:hypothetical protein [Bacillus sp. FJAT-50079]MBS4207201.1 hypothetical protein [Bacillus sp. FJAT-50079]
MIDIYDKMLKKAKDFHISKEKYEQLEKVMFVAKRAKLFQQINELEIKNSFDFALSLTGATALYESFKALGDEGRIAYLNEKNQFVHHYADGRINVIKERT